MNEFTEKDVKRSIRDFNTLIEDILYSDYHTYKARIKAFLAKIKDDNVIHSIVKPLMEIDVDLNKVHKRTQGHWIDKLDLPTDRNDQIAYILKVFKLDSEGSFSLEGLAFDIYQIRRISDNIEKYLYDIARPCLRELSFKLQDLVVDEVEGKEVIPQSSLQIINYGNISATDGANVAIGENIHQSIKFHSVSKRIMEQVGKEGIVASENLSEVEKIADQLEKEINNGKPSMEKLKDFAKRIFEIGKEGLLKVFSTVVNHPIWGQAVSQVLLGM